MYIVKLLLFASFFIANALADPIKVVVLDTGFGPSNFTPNLCKFGHADFSRANLVTYDYNTNVPVPIDQHGHGTDMVELIQRQLSEFSYEDYCIVIVKYFSTERVNPYTNFENELNSLRYIKNITPDVVNISSGGTSFDLMESLIVKDILDNGTEIVASAGNDGKLLSFLNIPGIDTTTYYPAMYDPRINVIGSLNRNNFKSRFSNYGNIVDHYEVGEVQTGRMGIGGGTSHAAAIFTGKLVKKLIIKRKNERVYKTYEKSAK
jgi:hypothetical protein